MVAQSRQIARITVAVLLAMLCGACETGQRDAVAESPREATAKPAQDATAKPAQDVTTTPEQNLNDARIIVPDHYVGAGVRSRNVDADAVRIESTSGQAGFCLDRPGRVTINEIQPEMSTGSMRVEAFALEPWDEPNDGSKIRLSRKPAVFDRAANCNPHDPSGRNRGAAMAGLRLKVRKIGHETAVADQLVMHYTSGGHPYEFSFRYSIALCSPVDVTTRECRPPE
ncbi:hypothetical protein ACLQ3B_09255 [Micromonospora sp. DT53]|uniref:hypothetical protein n=1 Tax=Micromonospora sp. DT53 TaxID=3393444 RepID=UPI003CF0FF7C